MTDEDFDAEVNSTVTEGVQRPVHIEGITECMIMQDTIHLAAFAIISNASSCINDKIDAAESYILDMYVMSYQAIDKIKEIRAENEECLKNIDGVMQISSALACVASASVKGTVVVGTTVPAIMLDVAQLITEISTLQVSVTVCMPRKALLTLAVEAKDVIVSIKDCIKEKIAGIGAKESLEEEKEPIIKQEYHNEIVDEHLEVQPNPACVPATEPALIEVQQ